jgi:hypothetical protein
MRWIYLRLPLALLLGSATGCEGGASRGAPSTPVTASAGDPADRAAATAAITHELDDFHDAAAHADEARYFGHF